MNTNRNQPRQMGDDAIDPTLEAMLDEALASPRAPRGLAERVVAATAPPLPRRRRPGVLARIGAEPVWRMAAAVVVAGLLAWAGLWLMTPQQLPTGGVAMNGHGAGETTSVVMLSEQEARELLAALAAAEGYDFDALLMEQRAMQVGDSAFHGTDEAWNGSHDPMEILLDALEAQWLGNRGPMLF